CWPPPLRPTVQCSTSWRPERRRSASDRRIAAVDEEVAAGDKAGVVAREIDGGAGDLLRASEAPRQVLAADRFIGAGERAVAPQRPLGLDRAGRQRVDPDVLRRVVDRHDLGELDQGALGRAIGGAAGTADPAKLRRDKDDRAAAA